MAVIVEAVDIKVAQNADGIYDTSFGVYGDFELDRSYETAIRMSAWLDSRADESEVKQEQLRRGWYGNFELYNKLHEIGCKLWLINQKRNTVKTRNDAKGYLEKSLQWLVDDQHAQKIEVVASTDDQYELILTINITFSADILKSFKFNLWKNTEEF